MFQFRLKIFIAAWVVVLGVIVVRLAELQVVRADFYRERAQKVLEQPPQVLPFVRGRILDRTGRVLVSEEPSWDIRVKYPLLAGDEGYLARLARRYREEERWGDSIGRAEAAERLLDEIEESWRAVARFKGVPVHEIHERIDEIVQRVQRIRAAVRRHRGYDAPVREEYHAHAIVEGLDDQQQVRARVDLAERYPWLRVDDGTRRVYHDVMPLAHILGRIGAVDAEDIEEDPRADDPLGEYKPNDVIGIAGVEKAAEQMLRGYRGRVRKNLDGDILEEIAPRDGRDVTITIRADLQQRIYDAFGAYLHDPENAEWLSQATGGAIVVLDIPTREVLAMVSHPSFDPTEFDERYKEWRADTLYTPLRFRAVANQYAPGSIVKPMAALAGLSSGRIGLNTTFTCTGYMFPSVRDAWRCWRITGTNARKAHGTINVVEAIEGSCNVFMYHVGDEIGVAYLTSFFDMFGLGNPTGIGLREEATGLNPTPDWLSRRSLLTRGKARLLSIGQAEVTVTPVQAANMFAQYASGIYKPLTLIRGLREDTNEWRLPGDDAHWDAVREGLFRVVNSEDGTAYYYARYTGDRYRICGKTGSATTPPRPLSYRVEYTDADGNPGVEIVPAGSKRQAGDDLRRRNPDAHFEWDNVTKYEWWPAGDENERYAHAWFGGFLQPVDEEGEPRWHRKPHIAFIILVEFGGSGGHSAAPFAKKLVPLLMEVLGPDLDPDGHLQADAAPDPDGPTTEVHP